MGRGEFARHHELPSGFSTHDGRQNSNHERHCRKRAAFALRAQARTGHAVLQSHAALPIWQRTRLAGAACICGSPALPPLVLQSRPADGRDPAPTIQARAEIAGLAVRQMPANPSILGTFVLAFLEAEFLKHDHADLPRHKRVFQRHMNGYCRQ